MTENGGQVPRVHVEPWPTGGWAVWQEGGVRPLSRHDTEEEAQFRARAYRRVLAQGQRLVLGSPSDES